MRVPLRLVKVRVFSERWSGHPRLSKKNKKKFKNQIDQSWNIRDTNTTNLIFESTLSTLAKKKKKTQSNITLIFNPNFKLSPKSLLA